MRWNGQDVTLNNAKTPVFIGGRQHLPNKKVAQGVSWGWVGMDGQTRQVIDI